MWTTDFTVLATIVWRTRLVYLALMPGLKLAGKREISRLPRLLLRARLYGFELRRLIESENRFFFRSGDFERRFAAVVFDLRGDTHDASDDVQNLVRVVGTRSAERY